MGPEWGRREILAIGVGLLAGCGMPDSPDMPPGVNGQATVSTTSDIQTNATSDPTVREIRFESSSISAQWTAEGKTSLNAWTGIYRNGSRYTGQLRTLPKSPLTRRSGEIPSDIDTQSVQKLSIPSNYPLQGYQLVHRFQFPVQGITMRFRWTLFGFAGKPYVLLHANLTNESTRRVTIDEDEGNRHAGNMLLRGCNLTGASVSGQSLEFKLKNEPSRRFLTVPEFSVFTGSPWATIYGPQKAITYGYLKGDTALSQWVTRPSALDLMTNGTTLAGGDQLEYYLFVGLHDGGSDAPQMGKRLFKEAKGLV